MEVNKISHSTLSRPLYDKIKQLILNKTLAPGQKIIQEKIAADLGVSRTPLNKALQMLEHEMLVESVPRRGIFVKKIDLHEMHDVFVCREALEAMAVKIISRMENDALIRKLEKIFKPFQLTGTPIDSKAYHLADEKFHKELIIATKNKVMDKLYIMSHLHDKITQLGLVRPPEETLQEHIQIIDAIRRKQPEEAAMITASHIRKSRELLYQEMNKNDNNNVSTTQ